MKALIVYLRLYGECLRKTGKSIAKNPLLLLVPVGALVARFVALLGVSLLFGSMGKPGGLIGGIILNLVDCALLSCYLYFLGETVSAASVTLRELKTSFRKYFWSVLNVFFVIWIAQLVLGSVMPGRQGQALFVALEIAALVACNAAPEVIYQRGTYGGLATLQSSLKFLQENLFEWGLLNALVLFGLYKYGAVDLIFAAPALVLAGILPVSALGISLGLVLLLHLFMLYRGHLFSALDGSSHRQRMYKYRNSL